MWFNPDQMLHSNVVEPKTNVYSLMWCPLQLDGLKRLKVFVIKHKKGLLALEGELAPILVQMVKSANTNGLLDNESDELHEFAGE